MLPSFRWLGFTGLRPCIKLSLALTCPHLLHRVSRWKLIITAVNWWVGWWAQISGLFHYSPTLHFDDALLTSCFRAYCITPRECVSLLSLLSPHALRVPLLPWLWAHRPAGNFSRLQNDMNSLRGESCSLMLTSVQTIQSFYWAGAWCR